MTMQTNNPQPGGFLHSVTGQMTVTIVVLVAIVLIAWRYVF
jgi:hypothetical protein